MNQPFFPVQTSVLSDQALLAEVLTKYPLALRECRFYDSHVNDIYRVKNESATFFLRICKHQWRTREDIEEEIDILNYLSAQNISVSRAVKSKDGTFLQAVAAPEGRRYAVLFTNAIGTPLDFARDRQSFEFGKITGRFHRCADQMDKAYNRHHFDAVYLFDEPINRICRFLPHRPEDCHFLRELGQGLKETIETLPRAKPGYGLCHGDLNRFNVHFADDTSPTLFDFEFFGYGWRVYDIAVFLWNMLQFNEKIGGQLDWQRSLDAFLEGYSEELTVDKKELDLLYVFVLVRHIWVMGIIISFSDRIGVADINDDFFNHHIGLIKRFLDHFKEVLN